MLRPRLLRAEFMNRRGDCIETPGNGIASMLTFYGSTRIRGCGLKEGGDMLLFQWGTYDWGRGERFELDLTRQLIWEERGAIGIEPEPTMWQMSLTYRFDPSVELRDLGQGNKWCTAPGDAPAFESFIAANAAYCATNRRTDGEFDIDFEQV